MAFLGRRILRHESTNLFMVFLRSPDKKGISQILPRVEEHEYPVSDEVARG